jgi:peptide chain release factor subunit 1
MGAVETLIVWENFDVMRYVLRNTQTQETKVICLRADQEKDKSHFQDKETGVELEHAEEMPLLEWYANNYKNFGKFFFRKRTFFMRVSIQGATLEIVTDKSQEGSQFVRGFGGVGGILRYKVDLQNLNIDEDAEPIDYSE